MVVECKGKLLAGALSRMYTHEPVPLLLQELEHFIPPRISYYATTGGITVLYELLLQHPRWIPGILSSGRILYGWSQNPRLFALMEDG